MMIADAILKVQRFSTPMKLIGVAFLAFHCVTTDIRFNPVWMLVYVAVAFTVANAGVAVERIIYKFHPPKKTEPNASSFTVEERRCLGQISDAGQSMRAKPWRFLLIAGEDGIFFIPLLYIGITVPSAIAAAALFTAIHYRLKPSPALVGTFVFSAANALIILPHGILPMVLGHFVLDAVVFGLAPTLRKWVEKDEAKAGESNRTSAATSESAPTVSQIGTV